MHASQAHRLTALERRLDRLKEKLAGIGFFMPGSVVRRFMPCGKPGCRCGADPPVLHGPYWQWSTKVAGKTVTRRLTAHEAEVYGDFVANRRRLENIVAEMEAVSARAAQILAEEGTGSATHAPPRSRATR